MDIYKATQDFRPPSENRNLISLLNKEYIEVLEPSSNRSNNEWWGVRRIDDDEIGLVPRNYLEFVKRVPISEEDGEERNKRLTRFQQMDRQEDELPDFHDLPPTCIQPFESNSDDYPVPDYGSDDERSSEDVDIDDLVDKQPVAPLTSELWDEIVSNAEDDLPLPPPPEDPTPDYEDVPDENEENGGYPEHPEELQIIIPKYTDNPNKPTGLIEPKKLRNPCKESTDRQNLHKELMLNQKTGRNPLNKKSELQKEMERRREAKKNREMEEYKRNKRTEMEIKLEELADKNKQHEYPKPRSLSTKEPVASEPTEFERIHLKISKTKSLPSKNGAAR